MIVYLCVEPPFRPLADPIGRFIGTHKALHHGNGWEIRSKPQSYDITSVAQRSINRAFHSHYLRVNKWIECVLVWEAFCKRCGCFWAFQLTFWTTCDSPDLLALQWPCLALPQASGDILTHRSHGCSSNPPADAPSLLPGEPATRLLWHACMSVHTSIHSFRPSSESDLQTGMSCGQRVRYLLPCSTNRVLEIISKINFKKKAICSNELFIGWHVSLPTLADEWLMATCSSTEPSSHF